MASALFHSAPFRPHEEVNFSWTNIFVHLSLPAEALLTLRLHLARNLFSFATLNASFSDCKKRKKEKKTDDAHARRRSKITENQIQLRACTFLARFQWHHSQLVQKDVLCRAVCLRHWCRRVFTIYAFNIAFGWCLCKTYETNRRVNPIWSVATHSDDGTNRSQMSYIMALINRIFRLHALPFFDTRLEIAWTQKQKQQPVTLNN